jgi:hypothetical protein
LFWPWTRLYSLFALRPMHAGHFPCSRNWWYVCAFQRQESLVRLLQRRNFRYGSFATELGCPRDVRLSPNSGGIADITVLRVCAKSGHDTSASAERCGVVGFGDTSANQFNPLSSWRRVRGRLDWLSLAGHRRGHPMKRREFIAATTVLLVSPRRSLAQGTRRRVGFLAMDVVEPTVRRRGLTGCETTAGLMEET